MKSFSINRTIKKKLISLINPERAIKTSGLFLIHSFVRPRPDFEEPFSWLISKTFSPQRKSRRRDSTTYWLEPTTVCQHKTGRWDWKVFPLGSVGFFWMSRRNFVFVKVSSPFSLALLRTDRFDNKFAWKSYNQQSNYHQFVAGAKSDLAQRLLTISYPKAMSETAAPPWHHSNRHFSGDLSNFACMSAAYPPVYDSWVLPLAAATFYELKNLFN